MIIFKYLLRFGSQSKIVFDLRKVELIKKLWNLFYNCDESLNFINRNRYEKDIYKKGMKD